MSILALIAPVVTHPAAIPVVFAALVLWAAASGWSLAQATTRIRKDLERCRRILESAPNPLGFAGRFAQIRQELEGSRLLRDRWREWSETLVEKRSADQPIRATSRAAEWFDLGLYADAGVDLRYHQALPGLLVGAGLAFTFLGLTVALDSAGGLVSAEDPAARNTALRTLLDTASIKFIASLAGLGCSIGYALFRKGQLRRAETAIARFCEALERNTRFVTPAFLQAQAQEASDGQLRLLLAAHKELQGIATTLTASQAMHTRVHEELQLFNQSLAVNLGQALDKVLDQRLEEHLAKLARALETRLGERFERVVEALARQLHERDEQGVVELLRQLVERLEAGSAGHMQTVGAELAGLGARLGEISATLQGAAAGLKDHVDAAATTLGTSVEGVSAGLSAGAANAAAQLERAVGQLGEALRAPTELLAREAGGLAAAAAGLQDGLGRLRGLAVELATPLERAASGFDQAAARVQDATAPLHEAAAQTRATTAGLATAADQLHRVLEGQSELARQLDRAGQSFATVDQSLARTIGALREGLDGFAEKVREVVQAVDSELAKSVSGLQSLVSDLGETVEELAATRRAG